jgi:hypothetical protein
VASEWESAKPQADLTAGTELRLTAPLDTGTYLGVV